MEQVLGLQEFKAFAFMKPSSPWVQMGHGLGKFFSMSSTIPELNGKMLMFVGDRGSSSDYLEMDNGKHPDGCHCPNMN